MRNESKSPVFTFSFFIFNSSFFISQHLPCIAYTFFAQLSLRYQQLAPETPSPSSPISTPSYGSFHQTFSDQVLFLYALIAAEA